MLLHRFRLAARLELARLRKQKDRIQRDIDTIRNVSEGWKQEVRAWISQARELGLTDYEPREDETFDALVNEISKIVEKNAGGSELSSQRITDINRELIQLRQEERTVSSELFLLQKRHKDMLELMASIGQYEASLQIQLQRLEISSWLRSLSSENIDNPLVSISSTLVREELDKLCNAISVIEQTAGDMKTVPAAFERELQIVEEEIAIHTERLNAISLRITEESRTKAADADQKYTLNAMARFLGRLEASFKTYERIGKDSELESMLEETQARITELSREVNESDIRRKQDAAIAFINQKIGEIIQDLDVEHPDSPVEFEIKDLI